MRRTLLLLAPVLLLLCACERGKTIYLPAKNADGLQTGVPVNINGLQVGKVVDVELDEQLTCWLTLKIEEGYQIGNESIFHLETISILGAKTITIENALVGETINSGDSLNNPIIPKSLLDTYGSSIDSAEQAELSRKIGELMDLLLEAAREE